MWKLCWYYFSPESMNRQGLKINNAFFIPATVIFRVIAFPLVIMAQKNVAHLNNHMPKMQQLQQKMTDARQRGDVYESAILGGELQTFMKEKGVNPLKNVIPLFLQFPLFAGHHPASTPRVNSQSP